MRWSGRPAWGGILALTLGVTLLPTPAPAAQPPKPSSRSAPSEASADKTLSTEELAVRAQPSLVLLLGRGRDGTGEGTGTGFVVDSRGLIATSLHVVGESRPFAVRRSTGEELEVLAIHAFDRHTDLALVQVNATNLPALPLGDSDRLAVGADVVALGNPLGLENSIVAGVLSARRPVEDVEMLQLAIPIEPGNSGGPVLDRAGRVQGIVNAKSLLTRNLGFATPINLLKPLIEQPNPVPYARWIRSSALDPQEWEPHLGAHWRQRAGRIRVEGAGSGFGGRSYLIRQNPAPESAYEVTVTVRLQDESGAAGLVFGGTPEGTHYGFYPTGGNLRLTAFEGDEVTAWRILGTVPHPTYRPGEWNTLKVRHDRDTIRCWVNGAEVFSLTDGALRGRQVGLAKFRNTIAEFRQFQCAESVDPARQLDPATVELLGGPIESVPRPRTHDLAALRNPTPAVRAFLMQRSHELELEATRLRELADRLHRDQVRDDLVTELNQPETSINLARAALLVSRYDNPDLDVATYLRQLNALAQELRGRFQDSTPPGERLDLLRTFLFQENGFHGSRHDYSNRANSYLNDVLDDREGLPITLSFIFLTVAEAAGVGPVRGIPLPGHFLVKYLPADGEGRLIDVFEGGRFLTYGEADEIGSGAAGIPIRSEFLEPATKREMITRMITNLQSVTERRDSPAASIRYADLLVAIAGNERREAAQRIDRARLHHLAGNLTGARDDLQWVLDREPEGISRDRLQNMLQRLDTDRRQ